MPGPLYGYNEEKFEPSITKSISSLDKRFVSTNIKLPFGISLSNFLVVLLLLYMMCKK